MSIFGFVWVASWFGCFPTIAEKLIEAPKYWVQVFSNQTARSLRVTRKGSSDGSATPSTLKNALNSVRSSFNIAAPIDSKLNQSSPVLAPSSEQSASANAVLLGAIESFLFSTPSQNPVASPDTRISSQESAFQPIAWTVSSEAVSDNPLNYLAEVVQNFFSGVPSLAAESSSVVVLQAGTERSESLRQARTGFWRCAAWQQNPSQTAMGGFQIWVKGCLMAEVPSQLEAEAIAQKLEDLLKNPSLDASQLRPSLERNHAAGKWGDRVLFVIDDELAAQFERPAELVAIEWVNNLRVALGESPLSLADAQIQMHGLQNTGDSISGLASWYGPYFHGRETATGEIFDQNELTAAHPSLPFGTYLKVTNLANGKSVVVRVNDRGPYFDNRVLDLSNRAARCIHSDDQGVVPIEAVVMQPTLNENIAFK
ncbi:septal ring lytic transglycosylase RlpA family protein [Phormidesmis priestleyi]